MQPSHERWLVSYADFITLMFAFFAVLYASSTVDARKLESMIKSMQYVFAGNGPPPPRGNSATGEELRVLESRLKDALGGELVAGRVTVEQDARGLVVSIMESGSFTTGSADLPEASKAMLARIAARLADLPNTIRVEGHTDDIPIRTARYASNWDLSTARATRVVETLRQDGLSPARLSAAGYAEFHPRVPNDSDTNRARNRRVDLVILNEATRVAEEPRR